MVLTVTASETSLILRTASTKTDRYIYMESISNYRANYATTNKYTTYLQTSTIESASSSSMVLHAQTPRSEIQVFELSCLIKNVPLTSIGYTLNISSVLFSLSSLFIPDIQQYVSTRLSNRCSCSHSSVVIPYRWLYTGAHLKIMLAPQTRASTSS